MLGLFLIIALAITPSAVIEEYLMDNYPWPDVMVENVEPEGTLPPQRPVSIITLRGPIGRAEFLFQYHDGSAVKVKADVTARDRVVKAIRSLKRDTVLDRSLLYTTLMDVRRIPRGALRSISEVEGKRLERSVRADTVIRQGFVSEPPLVRKGERVTIVYQSRSLRVTAPGVARSDGVRDQGIPVVNLSSKRTITCMVKDRGLVYVSF